MTTTINSFLLRTIPNLPSQHTIDADGSSCQGVDKNAPISLHLLTYFVRALQMNTDNNKNLTYSFQPKKDNSCHSKDGNINSDTVIVDLLDLYS